jgi:hypothetical protein
MESQQVGQRRQPLALFMQSGVDAHLQLVQEGLALFLKFGNLVGALDVSAIPEITLLSPQRFPYQVINFAELLMHLLFQKDSILFEIRVTLALCLGSVI